MKLRLALAILALLALGAGCSLTTTYEVNANNANSNLNTNTNTNRPATNVNKSDAIAYNGQAGKNALELLQQGHQVDLSMQGFVNAIDGRKPTASQFWAFYVNGKAAEVGAKDYQTKNNDKIEWKIEKF